MINRLDYKNGNLLYKDGRCTGQIAGTLHRTGYVVLDNKGKKLLAHRVIWEMFNCKIQEKYEIDHIKGGDELEAAQAADLYVEQYMAEKADFELQRNKEDDFERDRSGDDV